MIDTIEFNRPGFVISTDRSRLQINVIHDFLSNQSYWAQGRPVEVIQLSIENSLCFGVYAISVDDPDIWTQVGFARVVTDYATFAWLCDVFVVPSHRKLGLSKWLVECVTHHPYLNTIRRIILATSDAHELYRKYGEFEPLTQPERWMIRTYPKPPG